MVITSSQERDFFAKINDLTRIVKRLEDKIIKLSIENLESPKATKINYTPTAQGSCGLCGRTNCSGGCFK